MDEREVIERVPKQLFIGGTWRDSDDGVFEVYDPGNGSRLCEVADGRGIMVRLATADGPATAMAVLRSLDAAKIGVAGLALREPSLDDVFLSLTGHAAEETADTPQEATS